MRTLRERVGEERGSALVLAGLGIAALIGMSAFAVDVAMLYSTRGQAQRAADAAALAGVGAYVDYQPQDAPPFARQWARDYATRNAVGGQPVGADEVVVETNPDSLSVTVEIRRAGINLWFARTLGMGRATVSARARAFAADAEATACVKPLAIADAWSDRDDDKNGNRVIDRKERWRFEDDKGDHYRPFVGETTVPPETGYGSTYRSASRDYGLELYAQVSEGKPKKGKQSLYAWDLPELGWMTEPDDEDEKELEKAEEEAEKAEDDPVRIPACDVKLKRKKKSRKLSPDFEADVCECNSSEVQLNTEYPVITAKKMRKSVRTSTKHAIHALLQADPAARWDETTRQVVGSRHTRWLDSPRVFKIGVYEPGSVNPVKQKYRSGSLELVRFVWVFAEGWDKQDQLRLRIIRPVRIPRLTD